MTLFYSDINDHEFILEDNVIWRKQTKIQRFKELNCLLNFLVYFKKKL